MVGIHHRACGTDCADIHITLGGTDLPQNRERSSKTEVSHDSSTRSHLLETFVDLNEESLIKILGGADACEPLL